MSANTETRRLAAIMFADRVGDTALTQREQALALEWLEEPRGIVRRILPTQGGLPGSSRCCGCLLQSAFYIAV